MINELEEPNDHGFLGLQNYDRDVMGDLEKKGEDPAALRNLDDISLPSKNNKDSTNTNAPSRNPASVAKRNARERKRIKNVNKAFDELRQHVPLGGPNKKISKVMILLLMQIYNWKINS